MKLKIKKYDYLVNDITNALLKKDGDNLQKKNKILITVLIIICVVLLLSLLLNIYYAF